MRSAQTYLEIVHDRGQRRLPLQRVYRNLKNRDLFLAAYGKLYTNQGATTKGVDPDDTVDGMSLKRIDDIIDQLRQGTYQWTAVRRTYIDKKNGKKRALGLPGWKDKLLQQVLKMVLEAYYEPQFSDQSHGFRPNRGCHTALREIYTTWKGTKWFIEGDIQNCFNELHHPTLLAILERDIKDKQFIKLIKGMLDAGYVEDWQWIASHSGVPQGGVLSPLISNLYLNELDQFVQQELIPQYNIGQSRRINRLYARLNSAMSMAKKQGNIEQYQRLKRQKQTLPSRDPQDPHYRRLRYCRYADDWLIGFVGTHQEAQEIKQKIQAFLQTLHLTLSEEKTLITHATTGQARFLGYDVSIGHDNTKLTNHKKASRWVGRSLNGKVILSVPDEVTRHWQTRFSKNSKPVHRPYLLNCSDYEIVLTYGLEFRGLVNYYALAHNVAQKLNPVRYHYQQSLIKTLAAKHKQKIAWVYRKYRRTSAHGLAAFAVEIDNPNNPDKPFTATFGGHPIRYNPKAIIPKPVAQFYPGRNDLVTRLLANTCELCQATDNIQVHHVRQLKDIKKKYAGRPDPPAWVQFMMARHRKTIVVCHQCHLDIHAGRYDQHKVDR